MQFHKLKLKFLQLFYNVSVSENNKVKAEIATIDIADQNNEAIYTLIGELKNRFSFDENTG